MLNTPPDLRIRAHQAAEDFSLVLRVERNVPKEVIPRPREPRATCQTARPECSSVGMKVIDDVVSDFRGYRDDIRRRRKRHRYDLYLYYCSFIH